MFPAPGRALIPILTTGAKRRPDVRHQSRARQRLRGGRRA